MRGGRVQFRSYQVCATVKRRCFGMLLLKSILRNSLGEFLGEMMGDNFGEIDEDFWDILSFSCCNRFSLRVFTRSSLSHGFWQCVLSTSGTIKVSGLVVCWAMFPKQLILTKSLRMQCDICFGCFGKGRKKKSFAHSVLRNCAKLHLWFSLFSL